MKKFNKKILLSVAILFTAGLIGPISTSAATATIVDLGSIITNDFVILSETGITSDPASDITGNIGTSLDTADSDAAFAGIACVDVTGSIYSIKALTPIACELSDVVLGTTTTNTAVSDMGTAYTDAANQTEGTGASFLNVGSGTLNGQTFVPGVYTWKTPVTITGNITLDGGADDIWVFQMTGTLDLETNQKILLTGGALSENIFWQVADTVTIKAGSTFEGNILSQTLIAMQSGAILHGRALAQTAVTLIGNTITNGIVSDEDNSSDDSDNTEDEDDSTSSESHSSTGGTIFGCKDPNAINYNYFSSSKPSLCTYAGVVSVITSTPVVTTIPVIVPKLPKTGFPSFESDSWYTVLFNKILNIIK